MNSIRVHFLASYVSLSECISKYMTLVFKDESTVESASSFRCSAVFVMQKEKNNPKDETNQPILGNLLQLNP